MQQADEERAPPHPRAMMRLVAGHERRAGRVGVDVAMDVGMRVDARTVRVDVRMQHAARPSNTVVVVHLPSVGGITPPVRVAGRI